MPAHLFLGCCGCLWVAAAHYARAVFHFACCCRTFSFGVRTSRRAAPLFVYCAGEEASSIFTASLTLSQQCSAHVFLWHRRTPYCAWRNARLFICAFSMPVYALCIHFARRFLHCCVVFCRYSDSPHRICRTHRYTFLGQTCGRHFS